MREKPRRSSRALTARSVQWRRHRFCVHTRTRRFFSTSFPLPYSAPKARETLLRNLSMDSIDQNTLARGRPIPRLRWWICGMLFASTVINYIDRQTFSVLGPFLKQDYHWTNSDYAALWIGFRAAYTIGQTLCGRLMDRIGTRRGLSLTVLWYSLVS